MLASYFSMVSSKLLLGCFSMATCLISTLFLGSFPEPALAGQIRVDMPIYSRTSSDDLISQAESMAEQEINQYFNSDPELVEAEVVVLGSRNGDVIPILTTTVSRSQWQENPQASAWSKYYTAYALLRRHDRQPPTQVAAAPSRRSTSVASRGLSIRFDRQFDSGRLDGRTVQAYADLVD